MNNSSADSGYVMELQRNLRRLSQTDERLPELAVDGIYGEATRRAVRIFQETRGLSPTGVVNKATWDAIYGEYIQISDKNAVFSEISPRLSPDEVLRLGSRGEAVSFLQVMINALSSRYINITSVPYDGVYSESTAAAVRGLQRAAGLAETGEVDRATWSAIEREFGSKR